MRTFSRHGGVFDPDRLKFEVRRLEEKTGAPDFWNDREQAEKTLGELKQMRDRFEPWEALVQESEDLSELVTLAKEESDSSVEQEIRTIYGRLNERYEKLRIQDMLSGPHDGGAAFLSIHAGAGGTEACDWVGMLLRMYTRFMERRGFKAEILDLQEAEGGVKSVTMQLEGLFAFGYLKAESGVHRLVRISPFDSSGRRHTSFASVYVSPVIEDDIDVDIRPEDIRVDTYRASGAGGQHVNKTDSAIRITHLATGLVVQCQNERSQHKNRATAMKVLRSRLYEFYYEERQKESEKTALEKKDIGWGSQIRSYVFHPYNMVKDHRTKKETANVQAVMDGDIDGFIEEFLKADWSVRTAAV